MSREATGNPPDTGTLLRWLAEHGGDAYLVGGCIRDRLLGRDVHDIDLVVPSGGLALARSVADRFAGAYYPLDEARGTGRALFPAARGGGLVVDVSQLRGPDLAADLADRDFTVNALAEDLDAPGQIVDLFHGIDDLRMGVIRPVGPASIRNDPVRALRAVRLAAELGFILAPETVELIRQDGPALADVSGERVRDDLARILSRTDSVRSVRLLDELGLLSVIFPELEPLRGMAQPAPHHLTGLAHTLETVGALERLVSALSAAPPGSPAPEGAAEPDPWPAILGSLAPRLVHYLGETLGNARPRLTALKLAALLHDTGKPQTAAVDAAGRLRFIGHERGSQALAGDAMRRLHFAGPEVRLVEAVARNHMRPLLLAQALGGGSRGGPLDASGHEVSARAVYRFFRDTGDSGVAVLLHALADQAATYEPGSSPGVRGHLLGLVVRMVGDYFERPSERVTPPPLLNGYDLQRELGLAPGPRVGRLLEALREAQASGEVHTRDDALALVRRLFGPPAS